MARTKNLFIDQGANAQINVHLYYENNTPFDLTGYTANANFTRYYGKEPTTEINCVPYANGLIVLSINAATTGSSNAGKYVYDVQINHTSSNTTSTIQKGVLTIYPKV